jgi:hypothetical protein
MDLPFNLYGRGGGISHAQHFFLTIQQSDYYSLTFKILSFCLFVFNLFKYIYLFTNKGSTFFQTIFFFTILSLFIRI